MFRVEVKVTVFENGERKEVWKAMRPSHGEPYTFDTHAEAEQAMRLHPAAHAAHGGGPDQIRIVYA